MVLTCVARLFPRLNSIVLLIGNRVTPSVFTDRLAALAITSIRLQVCDAYIHQPLCMPPMAAASTKRIASGSKLLLTLV